MSIPQTTRAWLDELLTDAERGARPTAWERSFLADIRARLAEWGLSLSISEAQLAALRRIEEKIHADG